MKYEKFNEDRLRKYAQYLMAGKLKCEKLREAIQNDENVNDLVSSRKLKPLLLLPIMEIPQIFPSQWYYDGIYMPVFKENSEKETIASVIQFFGINRYMFEHIWSPGNQMPEIYGGRKLGPKPSVKEIANNIFELIDVVKYYEGVKGNDMQINLN